MPNTILQDVNDQANTGQVTLKDFTTAQSLHTTYNNAEESVVKAIPSQNRKELINQEINENNKIDENIVDDEFSKYQSSTQGVNIDFDRIKNEIDEINEIATSDVVIDDISIDSINIENEINNNEIPNVIENNTYSISVSDEIIEDEIVEDEFIKDEIVADKVIDSESVDNIVEYTRQILDTEAMNNAGYFIENDIWTQSINESFTNTKIVIQNVEVVVDAYNNEDAKFVRLNHKNSTTGIVELDHEVKEIDISIKSYKVSKDDAEIILYKEGEEVGRVAVDDIYDGKDNMATTITVKDYIFDSYEVISLSQHNSFGIGGAVEHDENVITTTTVTQEIEVEFEDTREVNISVDGTDFIMTTETYTVVEAQDAGVDINHDIIELKDIIDTNDDDILLVFGDEMNKLESEKNEIDEDNFHAFTHKDVSILIDHDIATI